ncbi:MAG: aminoacetone oxidase family FAD-binding enzyme [Planctomycetota bacterium]
MRVSLAVVGAGAAGLMATIWAGREARRVGAGPVRIVALDGAKKIGAKILVAGGGRCNVTHHAVTADAYAGGSRSAIKKVLRRFDVPRVVEFFGELGVEFKREETGKLFPTTDRAQTVLDALLRAADDAGVEIRHPARVERIVRCDGESAGSGGAFRVEGAWGAITADRVILATGGKALPRSGSDGAGYEFARALGHTITERVFPALVPLKLGDGAMVRGLSGVAAPARIELRSGTGKRLQSFTGPTLCTHFGISGPAPMDMSRYLAAARAHDPRAHLVACWVPELDRDIADRELQHLGRRTVGRWVRDHVPNRLALALCEEAGVDAGVAGASLTREGRRALVSAIYEMHLDVVGDRGFTHAETTAGGVPLDEVAVSSMASRACPGMHLCGEILDVDGRIGGFNFQWAWASGFVAGTAAGAALGEGDGRSGAVTEAVGERRA